MKKILLLSAMAILLSTGNSRAGVFDVVDTYQEIEGYVETYNTVMDTYETLDTLYSASTSTEEAYAAAPPSTEPAKDETYGSTNVTTEYADGGEVLVGGIRYNTKKVTGASIRPAQSLNIVSTAAQ